MIRHHSYYNLNNMKEGFTLVDSVSVPSDYSSISMIETMIDKVCGQIGVHEDNYGNVLIAVTEAVNNAIQHGNMLNHDLTVDVAVGDKIDEFYFSVLDKGNGFDYNNLPDPTAPENIEKENGRGIFLMKSLADSVEFDDLGRRVTIYFNKL